MKVAAVGDPTFIAGFELIGIEGFMAETAKEAKEIVSELIKRDEYGLIILPERFVEATEELRLMLMKEGRLTPLFAFLPDYTGVRGKRVEELKKLLSLAVGAELKL